MTPLSKLIALAEGVQRADPNAYLELQFACDAQTVLALCKVVEAFRDYEKLSETSDVAAMLRYADAVAALAPFKEET